MTAPFSARRWAAIRALREREAPTYALLGAATGISPGTIRHRASLEGWSKQPFQSKTARDAWVDGAAQKTTALEGAEGLPDGWEEMTPPERLDWLNAFCSRQIAQIVAEADGGALNKPRIDAVLAMIRVIERSKTLALERAADNETESDADLAERLRRIDDRIVELAEKHAEWLVGTQHRG